MTHQSPDYDLAILGTEEEQVADEEAVLEALRLMPTQTFDELAGNTSIDTGYVRLAVRRLETKGLARVTSTGGREYVSLQGG
jgi:hypothetical protein